MSPDPTRPRFSCSNSGCRFSGAVRQRGGFLRTKLTVYPHGITASSAEFDGNPECQGRVFARFKELALYLNAQDRGAMAAAAVVIRQLADAFGCSVELVGNPGYEVVRIESSQATA